MKLSALLGSLLALANARKDYSGYKIIKTGSNDDINRIFREHAADVWDQNREQATVLAQPELLDALSQAGVDFSVEEENVQQYVDNEHNRLSRARVASTASPDFWFMDYRRYDESKAFLEYIVSKYPHLATFIPSIGKSIEGRDIFAIRITAGNGSRKPKIFYQGQQHAREWISNATVQYLIVKLLEKYGTDSQVTKALRDFEYIIVPFVNPDGYEYSHDEERFWRKNRRDNGDGIFGVDTNRNWDANWAGLVEEGASSDDPNSNVYHGTAPFSEPETKAIANLLGQESNVIVAIDWHCYSQLILRAPGDTEEPTIHEEDLAEAGRIQAEAIFEESKKVYENILSIGLYPTTGTAGDWFYAQKYEDPRSGRERNVYGYTYELRPAADEPESPILGFVLPPEQIVEVGDEVFKAMLLLNEYAVKNPLWSDGEGDEPEECKFWDWCCRFGWFCKNRD